MLKKPFILCLVFFSGWILLDAPRVMAQSGSIGGNTIRPSEESCLPNDDCETEYGFILGAKKDGSNKGAKIGLRIVDNQGTCEVFTNPSDLTFFIPTRTQAEFNSFRKSATNGYLNQTYGVSVTACRCGDNYCEHNLLEDCNLGLCPGDCDSSACSGVTQCGGGDLTCSPGEHCTGGAGAGYNPCPECGVCDCSSSFAPTPCCGNNIREAGELCDGTDLNGETCASLGLQGTVPGCDSDCQGFDSSLCGPLFTCTGNLDTNANLCPNDNVGLTAMTPYTTVDSCSGPLPGSIPNCETTCKQYYHDSGINECSLNECGPSPTSNASYWDTEETTDVPSDGYVSNVEQSDTATKCQLQCNTGYFEDFTNICDQVVCGTVPDDATLIPGDDSFPISVEERAVWVVTADTSRKCEATCDTGFVQSQSGNGCMPANYNQCTANNLLYRVQGGTQIGYRLSPTSGLGGHDADTCPEFCESIPDVDYCEVHTYAVTIFLGTWYKKDCRAYSGGSLVPVASAYNTYSCN